MRAVMLVAAMVVTGCRCAAPGLETGSDVVMELSMPSFPKGLPILVNEPPHALPGGFAFDTVRFRPRGDGRLTASPLGLSVRLSAFSGTDAVVSDRNQVKLLREGQPPVACGVVEAEVTAVALSPTAVYWAADRSNGTAVMRAPRIESGCGAAEELALEPGSIRQLVFQGDRLAALRAGEVLTWDGDGNRSVLPVPVDALLLCAGRDGLVLVTSRVLYLEIVMGTFSAVTAFASNASALSCGEGEFAVAIAGPAGTLLQQYATDGALLQETVVSGDVTGVGTTGGPWAIIDGLARNWDGTLREGDATHLIDAWASGDQLFISQLPGWFLHWDGSTWSHANASQRWSVPDGRGAMLDLAWGGQTLELREGARTIASWSHLGSPSWSSRLLFSDPRTDDLLVEVTFDGLPSLFLRHEGSWHRPPSLLEFQYLAVEGDTVVAGRGSKPDVRWALGADGWVEEPARWGVPSASRMLVTGARLAVEVGRDVSVFRQTEAELGIGRISGARLLGSVGNYLLLDRDGTLAAYRAE